MDNRIFMTSERLNCLDVGIGKTPRSEATRKALVVVLYCSTFTIRYKVGGGGVGGGEGGGVVVVGPA